MAPQLTSFAAPRGGAGLLWGGPAGDLNVAPQLTSFAAPEGAQVSFGAARQET